MKFSTKLLITLLAFSSVLSFKIKNFPWTTPKAQDLSDHFGTEPTLNIYGPHKLNVDKLAREGITGESTPVSPISNFSKEINPREVVSGDLLNTSYDASKIIKAPLADPKFDIKSNIVHEAVIKTPVQLGNTFEEKTVHTMNRVTGEITKKTVTVEKPIVGVVNNVREVNSEHQTLVNLKDGKIIDTYQAPSLHGLPPQ